jgi:Mg2+ and Co2+ transporter CorA
VSDTLDRMDVQFGANVSGLANGMAAATSAVRDATSQISQQFSGVASALEGLKAPFLAFSGMLAGGAIFGAAIKGTTEWEGAVVALSRQLGTGTVQTSGLAVALRTLGIDTETYGSAVYRLQMALRTNEDQLNRNGIKTRDSRGEMLAIDEVMQNALRRLGDMGAGYDRNALALDVFGRSAKELAPLMRLTTDRIAEGTAEAQRLGLVVGGEAAAQLREYKESLENVKLAFQGVSVQVGNALLPALTSLAQWFSSIAPAVIDPVVALTRTLVSVLSTTTAQVALLALALKAGLTPAIMAGWQAIQRFADGIRVQMALGAMEGVTGIRGFVGALQSMINPLAIGVAALVAGGYAFERWATSASRAAAEAQDAARKTSASLPEYQRLVVELKRLDDVTKDAKASADDHKAAEERKKLVIEQLKTIYPDFAKFLVDEKGNEVEIATAIERANAQRLRELDVQIAGTKAALEHARALQIEAAARSAGFAAAGAIPGAGVAGLLGAAYGSKAKDSAKAIETLNGALKDLLATREALSRPVESGDQHKGKDKGGSAAAKPKDPMTDYRRELELTKNQAENWYTWSDEREAAFWQTKLATAQKGSDLQLEIEIEIAKAKKSAATKAHEETLADLKREQEEQREDGEQRIALATRIVEEETRVHGAGSKQVEAALREKARVVREVAAEELAITRRVADATRDAQLEDVRQRQEHASALAEMGEITEEQELAALRKLEDRKYEIERQALMQELQLQGLTFAAYVDLMMRIGQLDKQHAAALAQLTDRAAAVQKQTMARYLSPLEDAWKRGLDSMLAHTLTWRGLLQGVWSSINGVFANVVKEQLQQWIQMEYAKLGITKAVKALELALRKLFGLQEKEVVVEGATTEVAAKGASAAAGAASSAAAVPGVGWAMAIPVAMGVLAAVLALKGGIGSAAAGWDIGNENPIAQLHKREMVLPEAHADVIRSLAGRGVQGQTIHQHNWNVQALDARSFEDYLRDQKGSLTKVLGEVVRDGRWR